MIDLSLHKLIKAAGWRLDDAVYPGYKKKPKIWDPNFIISIAFSLLAIAKALEAINLTIRNLNSK